MLTDDYIKYQNIYEKKYGKNTVIFMQCGSFFEIYAMDETSSNFNLENLQEISNILNIQITKR